MAGRLAKQKYKVAERRRQVAMMYASHMSQAEIAKRLGVHVATISRDVAVIEAEWMDQAAISLGQRRARELAELDDIEYNAADSFSEDKNPRWLEVRLKCKERRAKLLGFDAASKVEISGAAGRPVEVKILEELSDDELRAIAES